MAPFVFLDGRRSGSLLDPRPRTLCAGVGRGACRLGGGVLPSLAVRDLGWLDVHLSGLQEAEPKCHVLGDASAGLPGSQLRALPGSPLLCAPRSDARRPHSDQDLGGEGDAVLLGPGTEDGLAVAGRPRVKSFVPVETTRGRQHPLLSGCGRRAPCELAWVLVSINFPEFQLFL